MAFGLIAIFALMLLIGLAGLTEPDCWASPLRATATFGGVFVPAFMLLWAIRALVLGNRKMAEDPTFLSDGTYV